MVSKRAINLDPKDINTVGILSLIEGGKLDRAYFCLTSNDGLFSKTDGYVSSMYLAALAVRFKEFNYNVLIKAYNYLLPLVEDRQVNPEYRWVTATASIIMERLLHMPMLVGRIASPPQININKISTPKRGLPMIKVMNG